MTNSSNFLHLHLQAFEKMIKEGRLRHKKASYVVSKKLLDELSAKYGNQEEGEEGEGGEEEEEESKDKSETAEEKESAGASAQKKKTKKAKKTKEGTSEQDETAKGGKA